MGNFLLCICVLYRFYIYAIICPNYIIIAVGSISMTLFIHSKIMEYNNSIGVDESSFNKNKRSALLNLQLQQ